MCGLAGFAVTKPYLTVKPTTYSLFLGLFMMAQLRGFDATGLAVCWKQFGKHKKTKARRGWLVHKGLTSPVDVYKHICAAFKAQYEGNKGQKDNFTAPQIMVAMGHCRAATKGAVTLSNAHPFAFGNNRFIGVHNGTIDNARTVFKELKDKEPLPNTTPPPHDYDDVQNDITDSEIVLYCIYRWGIEEVYSKIVGAWAFVWWDQESNNLHFLRNYQRPLFYAWSWSDDTIFWTSEKTMLEFSMKRHGFGKEFNDNNYKEFTGHRLYTMNLNEGMTIPVHGDITWTSEKDMAPIYNSSSSGSYSRWDGCTWVYNGDDEYDKENEKKKVPAVIVTPVPGMTRALYKDQTLSEHEIIRLRYSPIQKRCIPTDEWQAEQDQTADTETMLDELDDLEPDSSHCCWCGTALTNTNLLGGLPVKYQGHVCGVCASDLATVEEITDLYVETATDSAWIKRFCDLHEAAKRKDSNRA